ncbi:MAG: HAD family hydrolase [Caldilineaceae bacterium]
MIKAVLFDLDETLLDREAMIERFLVGQYARLGLQTPSYELYRARFKQLDEHGYADRYQVFQTLAAEFALPLSAEELLADFRRHVWQDCQPFPDAHTVLKELRSRGYPLGLITNGSSEAQRGKLSAADLAGYFAVILISEEQTIRKPEAAIFLRAAEKLSAAPTECIFIGDNPQADIAGAHAVGMTTVWRRGYLPWPAQLSITADYTIDELSQVLAIVV